MQRISDSVANSQTGRSVPYATITVTNYPSNTPATIYSDNGITVIAGGIITADAYGNFGHYAADGRYNWIISGAGITTYTRSDILFEDPAYPNPLFATTLSALLIMLTQQAL
jgi:hypothetical protein